MPCGAFCGSFIAHLLPFVVCADTRAPPPRLPRGCSPCASAPMPRHLHEGNRLVCPFDKRVFHARLSFCKGCFWKCLKIGHIRLMLKFSYIQTSLRYFIILAVWSCGCNLRPLLCLALMGCTSISALQRKAFYFIFFQRDTFLAIYSALKPQRKSIKINKAQRKSIKKANCSLALYSVIFLLFEFCFPLCRYLKELVYHYIAFWRFLHVISVVRYTFTLK